jgi:ammonium transporter Rh
MGCCSGHQHNSHERAGKYEAGMFDSALDDGEERTGANRFFGPSVLAVQGVLICCFYTADFNMNDAGIPYWTFVYNFYSGVACMMLVGFGYLMTFLKAYGLGAVGFTMFITCLGVEVSMVFESFMGKGFLHIDYLSLINGNFAVAAVLISLGGLIGRIAPLQIMVLTLMELFFYCLNKVYVLRQYDAVPFIGDCGGTIIIHVFGAYFGLAASKVLGPPSHVPTINQSSYSSDLFSLIGTVFLWLFWPSFVAGALPSGTGQTKAVVNTVLALLSSAVVTFGLTPILMTGKLGTAAIQNATLAGGVSIGAVANLVGPFGAMVIGALAGLLSTWGFCKSPLFGNLDTCGINNLHGMPGLLGGLLSAMVPFFYPNTGIFWWKQLVGLSVTLGISVLTGVGTGFVLKLLKGPKSAFWDGIYWECADNIPQA